MFLEAMGCQYGIVGLDDQIGVRARWKNREGYSLDLLIAVMPDGVFHNP